VLIYIKYDRSGRLRHAALFYFACPTNRPLFLHALYLLALYVLSPIVSTLHDPRPASRPAVPEAAHNSTLA
jgi:hypothetical protein